MYRSNCNPPMMPRGGGRGMESGNCGGNMAMRNNGRSQEKNHSMGKENGCCEDTRCNTVRPEENCCCENARNSARQEENCCCEKERMNIPVREEGCCCENAAKDAPKKADKICECNPSVHDQLAGMALAMAYVPWQDYKEIDSEADGWKNGTIFCQLDLDFMARRCN